MRRFHLLALALTALVSVPLPAQDRDPLRRMAIGMVRDLHGKPWAGAEVLLVSHRLPGATGHLGMDLHELQADGSGRFRVSLLRGRSYQAFARMPRADQPGVWRVTAAVTHHDLGAPFLLDELPEAVQVQTFRLAGAAAWAQHGPLRVRALVGGQAGALWVLRPGDEGVYTAPAGPGHPQVQVLDKRGLVLLDKALTGVGEGPATLRVPAPRVKLLAVRDVENGKGIAAAQVLVQEGAQLVELARTGPDGLAQLRWPSGRRINWSVLFAEAEGYTGAPFQTGASPRKDKNHKLWPDLRKGAKVDHHVHLRKGLHFKGQILLRAGEPAAGLELVFRACGMHFSTTNSRSVGQYKKLLRCDEQGRFELKGCLPETWWRARLDLLLDPRLRRQLGADWPADGPWLVQDLYDLSSGQKGQPNELPLLQLARLQPVRVVLRQADGREAAGAQLQLWPLWPGSSGQGHTAPPGWQRADRLGRVTLMLREEQDYGFLVHDGSGLAYARLETGKLEEGQAQRLLELQLGPFIEVRGRVLDAAGEPAADRLVRVARSAARGRRARTAPESAHELRRQWGVAVSELPPREAQSLLRGVPWATQELRTDAQGRFVCRVPAAGAEWRVSVPRAAGEVGAAERAHQELDLEEARDGRLEVELKLQ